MLFRISYSENEINKFVIEEKGAKNKSILMSVYAKNNNQPIQTHTK